MEDGETVFLSSIFDLRFSIFALCVSVANDMQFPISYSYFPTQKREKISVRRSSTLVSPVISPSRRSAS